jgi:C-7 ketoreductase
VAVVTGGGTGIGAASGRLLARRGLDVVVVGRRRENLEETVEAIAREGGSAVAVAADLADADAPARVVEEALRAFGGVDVLVNNAAVITTGPLEAYTREEFDEHVAVNVRAVFLLTQAALPALRRSPDAAIVNVSSSVGSIVKPGNTLYGMTKAAVEYLTRATAHELARDRIRVNCIAPGPVDTPIHAAWADDLAAAYRDLSARVPLGRMGEPEEVAHWVWELVSPETRWTTGNVIHVDGGQVLGPPDG